MKEVNKMISNTNVVIRISNREAKVISELLNILEACPIELSNDDYVDIIRAIAQGCEDTDIDRYGDSLVIEYEEE